MFQFFQTLPYRLTSTSPQVLRNYDAESRNKVTQLGILILLPAIIWFFNGILLTYQIMQLNGFIALITGVVLFSLILVIERAIVLANNVSRLVVVFRVLLALILSALGSMVLDACVFGKDINHRLKALAQQELETNVQSSYNIMDGKAIELHKEIHGDGVTKMVGFDKAAQNLQNQLNDSKLEYEKQKADYEKYKEIIKDPEHPQYGATMTYLGYDSYLKRIHVLHDMVQGDSMMKTTFWLLLLFGLFLELLPLVIKTGSKKSAYELDVEAQAALFMARRLRVLEQNKLYHAQTDAQKQATRLTAQRNSLNTLL
jgi:hypothetical protein